MASSSAETPCGVSSTPSDHTLQHDERDQDMNRALVGGIVTLLFALPVAADDAARSRGPGRSACRPGNHGNSDTQSLGFEFGLKRIPDPWGSRSRQSTSARRRTASRTPSATLRACAARVLNDRCRCSSGERRARYFAGFDLRGSRRGRNVQVPHRPVHALASTAASRGPS